MADKEKNPSPAVSAERLAAAEAAKRQAKAEALPAFTALVQSLDAVQRATLEEFRLINSDGSPGVTSHATTNKQGQSIEIYRPRVSAQAIRRLLALDETPDHRWTRWIFFQAGGGQAAITDAEATLKSLVTPLVAMLVAREKLTPAQAKAQTEQKTVQLRALMACADENLLDKYPMIFGWTLDFPGHVRRGSDSAGRYLDVEKVMLLANTVFRRIRVVNDIMDAAQLPRVSTDPADYPDLAAVRAMLLRVERSEAAAYLRTDIRHGKWKKAYPGGAGFADLEPWKRRNTVYADDVLTMIVPLTHAAAVEYGGEAWSMSSKAAFDARVGSQNPAEHPNEWSRTVYGDGGKTVTSVVAFVTFHVAMPAVTVADQAGQPDVSTYNKVAVVMRANGTGATVVTENGRSLPVRVFLSIIDRETKRPQDAASLPSVGQFDAYDYGLKSLTSDAANDPAGFEAGDVAVRVKEDISERVDAAISSDLAAHSSSTDDAEYIRAQACYLIYTKAKKAAQSAVQSTDVASDEGRLAGALNEIFGELLAVASMDLRATQLGSRGANVYGSEGEAEAVKASFTAAIDALATWVTENRSELDVLYSIQPPEELVPRKRRQGVKPADDVQDDSA